MRRTEYRHIGQSARKYQRVVASLMLLLFMVTYANINLFYHTHVINGVTIVHSHIHDPHHNDTDEGGHTSAELTLIANMAAQFLTTGEMPETGLTAYLTLIQTLGCEQDAEVISTHLLTPSLRAPPVTSFS